MSESVWASAVAKQLHVPVDDGLGRVAGGTCRPSIEGDGKLLFQEVCERNLEGIVAKGRMSVYSEHGWLKIKNPKYTQAEGRHDMFRSFQRHSRR